MFDIILALVLVSVFAEIVTATSLETETIYSSALNKSELLEVFTDHSSEFDGMLPYEIRNKTYVASSTYLMNGYAKWYGNDRIETDIDVTSGSSTISFVKVRKYQYANIMDSAGTPLCSVDLKGELSIEPIIVPVNPALPITDIQVRNGIAYLSVDSYVSSDNDLVILNITDTHTPILLSSLNTGPGLSSLVVAGSYIYAAAPSTVGQLHIIKISSLLTPTLVKKYALPLPLASTSPTTGTTVFYDKGIVYLGTAKWDGDELNLVDVSVPSNPSKISGLETGSKINSLGITKGKAYIAASDMNQLRVLDIHNPIIPILLNAFSPSGWSRQEGKSVSIFEDTMSFGRDSGGFDIGSDHELFRWASSSQISQYVSKNEPRGIYGIISDRHHLFAISHELNKELQIYSSDFSTSTAYSLPVIPQAITCDQDKLYVLGKTAPVIYQLTFH